MIRGVNKLIIEINGIESGTFEKAILFVRPEQAGAEDAVLEEQAHRFLSDTEADSCPPGGFLRRRAALRRRLLLAAGGLLLFALGAAAALTLF